MSVGTNLASITAVGACGPNGFNSVQLSMCARSGCYEPRTTSIGGALTEPVGMCLAGGLADQVGYDRMLALSVPAALEAGHPLTKATPLLMALPSPGRADDDQRFETSFVRDLAARTGLPIDVERSAVFRHGHRGALAAIERAVAMLDECDRVLVGGASSYCHPGVVHELDRRGTLHIPGQGGGVTPGEASAFLVLERDGDDALAHVVAIAHGQDDAAGCNAAVGHAWTQTVHDALGRGRDGMGSTQHEVGWVLNDVTAEHARIHEWTRVAMRTQLANCPSNRLADMMGDVEAASGTVLAALACTWWRLGCAPNSAARALIALSEGHAGSGRSALVIARAEERS